MRILTKLLALIRPDRVTVRGRSDSENCRKCAAAWRRSGYNADARCPKHRR